MTKDEIIDLAEQLHQAIYKYQNDGNNSDEIQNLLTLSDDLREEIFVTLGEDQ